MTSYLPPNLLALFAPRDPIPFLPPIERPKNHRSLPYTGIAQYIKHFEDPSETPIPPKVETREEKRERKRKEKEEQTAYKLEQDLALWKPLEIENATEDPYKTLFVARISYDTTESKIRREFESYGTIKTIQMIKNSLNEKPRGYCFIEYEHKRDMRAAYKHADGKKIDGRRVLVDVERGRTMKSWRPRRLGGGLGDTRRGPPEQNSRLSIRDNSRDRDSSRRRRSRSKEHRHRDRERDLEKERHRDRHHKESRSDRSKRQRSRSKDRYKHRSRSNDRRKHRSRSRGKSRDRFTDKSKTKDRRKDNEKERENGVMSAAIRRYGEYGADMD